MLRDIKERQNLRRQVNEYCVDRCDKGLQCCDCPCNEKKLCISERYFDTTDIKKLRKEVDALLNGKKYKFDEERKLKDIKRNTRKKRSLDTYANGGEILRLDTLNDNIVIQTFSCMADAARKTGVCLSTIKYQVNNPETKKCYTRYRFVKAVDLDKVKGR